MQFFNKSVPNKLLKQIKAGGSLFTKAIHHDVERLITLGAMTFASQCQAYAGSMLSRKSLRVFVANADHVTLALKGQHFKFINTILGTDINWEFHLISTDHEMLCSAEYDIHPAHNDARVIIYNQETTVEKYIERNGNPDILVVNNLPILDSDEFHQWFSPQCAVIQCLNDNVLVFGASMGNKAYQLEAAMLSGANIQIEAEYTNPMSFSFSTFAQTEQEKDLMNQSKDFDWSYTCWRLGKIREPDRQLEFDYHELVNLCLSSIADSDEHGVLPHFGMYPSLTEMRLHPSDNYKRGRYLCLMSDYVLDLENNCIYRDFGQSDTPYKTNINYQDDRIDQLCRVRDLQWNIMTAVKVTKEHLCDESHQFIDQHLA